MILIDNRDELIKNLDTVESYLNGDNDEVVEIMAELIRKGKNFVAYNFNGSTHFAPSRFVGYKDNIIDAKTLLNQCNIVHIQLCQ